MGGTRKSARTVARVAALALLLPTAALAAEPKVRGFPAHKRNSDRESASVG